MASHSAQRHHGSVQTEMPFEWAESPSRAMHRRYDRIRAALRAMPSGRPDQLERHSEHRSQLLDLTSEWALEIHRNGCSMVSHRLSSNPSPHCEAGGPHLLPFLRRIRRHHQALAPCCPRNPNDQHWPQTGDLMIDPDDR